MHGPVQVALTTQVDTDLKDDFQELTDFLGLDPQAAMQEALREWMTRYAVIHHFPKYGFAEPTKETP